MEVTAEEAAGAAAEMLAVLKKATKMNFVLRALLLSSYKFYFYSTFVHPDFFVVFYAFS